MLQVVYLSYDGMTDPLGQSQVLPYLEGLSAKGIQFTLVSFEKPEARRREETTVADRCKQAGIQWIPQQYTKKPPVLSTLKDLWVLRGLLRSLIRQKKVQIIHCRSYLTTLIALPLAKKAGIKVLFDMRGLWIDERIEGGIWDVRKPIYKFIYSFLKKKEKYLLLESDAIVSLTHQACPTLKTISGKQNLHIDVIPCCADTNHFLPEQSNSTGSTALKRELGLMESQFVLSYLGAIGTWYMLDEMLDFFACLLKKFPTACFLFITREEQETIISKAKSKAIPRENIVIRSAGRAEVPSLLALSNASIFFIRPTFSKQASSPTKQAEIMSMGIPVICNSGVGDTDLIVKESAAGWIVNDLNEQAYQDVISQLSTEISDSHHTRIREAAIQRFALENGVESYQAIYKRLTGQA